MLKQLLGLAVNERLQWTNNKAVSHRAFSALLATSTQTPQSDYNPARLIIRLLRTVMLILPPTQDGEVVVQALAIATAILFGL